MWYAELVDYSGWDNARTKAALKKYQRVVHYHARGLGGRTRLDYDDLTSIGQLAVLEALEKYEGRGASESTWVSRRVRMRIIDAIRTYSPYTRQEFVQKEFPKRTFQSIELVADPIDLDEPPDEVVARNEVLDMVQEVLPTLTVKQRRVFEGRLADVKTKDLGRELGVTETRVTQLNTRTTALVVQKVQEKLAS